MPIILIDRRKAGRGKSLPNRQKLIKRIKSFIKASTPQNIGKQGGVTGSGATGTSPVRIAGNALEEPFFAYARDGEQTIILTGNNRYDRGDEIEFESNESASGGGPGENGEDDFIVNIARDEFLDLYFEDCELPNLVNEKFTEKLDNTFQHAGFTTTGAPSQLSVIRTYKQMLGRTSAIIDPMIDELEEMKKRLNELCFVAEADRFTDKKVVDEIELLRAQIAELESEIDFYDNFDITDLRYRRREAKPLKTVDAVLIMVMDISGSMSEEKKTIARRWFALLYAFIKRRYPITELVFIAHTDEPYEMSENDFFSTRINGGTCVSPALELVNKIILERYDPNQTNIYVCHASDGDNWMDDNPKVIDELVGSGNLLGKIQLFSYAEVGTGGGWYFGGSRSSDEQEDSNLWTTYAEARDKSQNGKIIQTIIKTADECYPVFKKVFKKRGK